MMPGLMKILLIAIAILFGCLIAYAIHKSPFPFLDSHAEVVGAWGMVVSTLSIALGWLGDQWAVFLFAFGGLVTLGLKYLEVTSTGVQAKTTEGGRG